MFYPGDSLKRGGRFYLCWVADSWPLRFATITHRQLWSQDIRRICDDLLEVMTNESGRPANRFSLRLSSQLLRGLVRLYQRKATIFLGELCMINANVMKNSNKKWNMHEVEIIAEVSRPQLQQLDIQEIIADPPENEQRIVDMIQHSGNVVSNIEDITLKEVTIAEVLPPSNDGFGEENPDQALQFLQDRTLEQMLVQPDVSTAHSGLEVALDITDKSHDKSRLDGFGEENPDQALQFLQDRTLEQMLVQPDVSTAHSGLEVALDITDKSHDKSRLLHEPAQMERISEHDVTLFRKSTGEELMPEFEKDIPEIPEIPPPELPVPEPDKPHEEPVPEAPNNVVEEPPKIQEPVEIELEELEEVAPKAKKGKFRNRLIVDKKTKIGPNYFRARIENPLVELRCEDSSDDIIFIRVPVETYFRRPCHGGEKIVSNLGFTISRLFSRNLGVVSVQPLADREMEASTEAIRRKSHRTFPRSVLENIEEEQVAPIVQDRPEVQVEAPIPEANVTNEVLNVSEPQRVSVEMDLDIADMPTQIVETLSQALKRTAESEIVVESPKRQRSVGYVSFRESQLAKEQSYHVPHASATIIITDAEADKENIPANIQPQDAELILSSKLQEAGLADIIQSIVPEVELHSQTQRPLTTSIGKSRKTGSDRSETPLGSLDRTKVSLGDSEQTTDSKRFIRDQWGTEGTMIKILKHIKGGLQPVTVTSLLDKGPVISGYRRIIAARCFTSILKLKQHGFIDVKKNTVSLEIVDVTLGPKLTSLNEQF